HGAWSPETHSDWLVDAADILAHDDLDWHRFQHIANRRGLQSQVRIGLSYLHHVMGLELPAHIVSQLAKACSPATLLIARPAAELHPVMRPLRHFSYLIGRRPRSELAPQHTPPLKLALARATKQKPETELL